MMKKLMLSLALAAAVVASPAFAGGFNQPMTANQFNANAGYHHGGGYGHGGANYPYPVSNPVSVDPKNPANVRDWSRPQAQSVYCLGAGCNLHYPTVQQQYRSGGNLVCNNYGCH